MEKRITNPTVIREICEKYNFRFKKGLGQNFLIDGNVIDSIVEGTGITGETSVVEIGPGFGALTQALIESAKSVTSIEIDDSLIPVLTDIFSYADNFTLINKDVLKLDLNEIITDDNTVLAANLPYYVTTPILSHILENKYPFRSLTVMVQKEVAKRMIASPGTKEYGAFTCLINYYSDPEILRYISPNCFSPAPKVDSAVVILRIPREPKYSPSNEKIYKRVVRAVFNKRRKTLLNALSSSFTEISKQDVENAIISAGFSPSVRGETLAIEDYIKISDILSENL